MPLFTVENALDMARRSAQARKEREQRRIEQQIREATSAPARRITELEREIQRIAGLIAKASDGLELDRLTKARERLVSEWAMRTGFPKQPTRGRSRRPSVSPDIQPVGVAPENTDQSANLSQ